MSEHGSDEMNLKEQKEQALAVSRERAIRKFGLKAVRLRQDLTHEACVDKINAARQRDGLPSLSRSTWRSWESNNRPINIQQLQSIEKGFSLSKDETRALIEWIWAQEA